MNLATPFRFAKLLQPLCAALKRAHPGLVTAPSALQHSSFPVCGGVGGFGGWGGVARGEGRRRRGGGGGGGVLNGGRGVPLLTRNPGQSGARISWQDVAFWQNEETPGFLLVGGIFGRSWRNRGWVGRTGGGSSNLNLRISDLAPFSRHTPPPVHCLATGGHRLNCWPGLGQS